MALVGCGADRARAPGPSIDAGTLKPAAPVSGAAIGGIQSLDLDANHVYVAARGDNTILALSKEGGATRVLAKVDPSDGTVDDVHVAGGAVTWLVRRPPGGQARRAAADADAGPSSLAFPVPPELVALAHRRVFYAFGAPGPDDVATRSALLRCETICQAIVDPKSLPDGPRPSTMAVTDTAIVWLEKKTLLHFTLPNGPLLKLLEFPAEGIARDVVADDVRAYWVENDSKIRSQEFATPRVGTRDVVGEQRRIGRLALDAGNVFWTDTGSGVVASTPKTGGDIRLLATEQPSPFALAIDESGVYWSTSEGVAVARR